MSVPGIVLRLLDGSRAAAHAAELYALHAEVYAEAPYRRAADPARFTDRFRVQRRQPGFVLAEARHGEYLVGYASGMPLRPATSWWRDLTTAPPAEVTAEHPGRTFALTELLVRASWRRQGIVRALHDLVVHHLTPAGRAELDRWLGEPSVRARGYRDDFFLKIMAAARSGDPATLSGVLSRQRVHLLRELRSLADARALATPPAVESLLITAAELHVRADLGVVDAAERALTPDVLAGLAGESSAPAAPPRSAAG